MAMSAAADLQSEPAPSAPHIPYRASVTKQPTGLWHCKLVNALGHGGVSEHASMQDAIDAIPAMVAHLLAPKVQQRGPACDVREVI